MTVSIHFFGTQRHITKTDSIHMPFMERIKVADAFEYVRGRFPALPLEKSMVLVAVNQKVVSFDTELKKDDSISFLPHIGGG